MSTRLVTAAGLVVAALLLTSCSEPDRMAGVVTDAQRTAATTAANMDALVEALNVIEARHRAAGTALVLADGATDDLMDATEGRFGCRLPGELRMLWAWRNGEHGDDFIWYHRFLSIDDALHEYQALTSQPWAAAWRQEWVPVFSFEGEWYGVECMQEPSTASPVIHYFIEDEPRVSYTNLTTFMQTMAVAMTSGAITWDGQAWVDDIGKLARIHAQRNPGVEFPYAVPE